MSFPVLEMPDPAAMDAGDALGKRAGAAPAAHAPAHGHNSPDVDAEAVGGILGSESEDRAGKVAGLMAAVGHYAD